MHLNRAFVSPGIELVDPRIGSDGDDHLLIARCPGASGSVSRTACTACASGRTAGNAHEQST
ncbi:hypothetical protein YDYSG_58220 [Paenibacillus tyrfis]|nr:hypothetical protein YDYSG_58220 [Paenibacillus tyrfis]